MAILKKIKNRLKKMQAKREMRLRIKTIRHRMLHGQIRADINVLDDDYPYRNKDRDYFDDNDGGHTP